MTRVKLFFSTSPEVLTTQVFLKIRHMRTFYSEESIIAHFSSPGSNQLFIVTHEKRESLVLPISPQFEHFVLRELVRSEE